MRAWKPTPVFLPGESLGQVMDREIWCATVYRVAKSCIQLKRFSTVQHKLPTPIPLTAPLWLFHTDQWTCLKIFLVICSLKPGNREKLQCRESTNTSLCRAQKCIWKSSNLFKDTSLYPSCLINVIFFLITISVYRSSHQSPKSCRLQGSEMLILFEPWFANALHRWIMPLAVLAGWPCQASVLLQVLFLNLAGKPAPGCPNQRNAC